MKERMKILLDTNALVWIVGESAKRTRLGTKARKLVQDADAVYVSSVSILELRIKSMLGKLEYPTDLLSKIGDSGLHFVSFDEYHADAVVKFPGLSKHDPFDRMLLAQAKLENMVLLTSDIILLNLGFPDTISARE